MTEDIDTAHLAATTRDGRDTLLCKNAELLALVSRLLRERVRLSRLNQYLDSGITNAQARGTAFFLSRRALALEASSLLDALANVKQRHPLAVRVAIAMVRVAMELPR